MNRSITANADDASACPKRQAVFYLREAMSHAPAYDQMHVESLLS